MALLMFQWFVALSTFFNVFPASPEISHKGEEMHPFYVSVTEINHNAAENTMEISSKIFTDDLEATLNKKYNKKLDLFDAENTPEENRVIADYLSKHLVMKLDGKPVVMELLGFEREGEAIWSYLQVSGVKAPGKVEITNSILYDAYTDQINLLHVTVKGTRKSTKLDYPKAQALFNF